METVNSPWNNESGKSLLRNLLAFDSSSTIMVQFTKVDGTVRNMKCTLNWDLIPEIFKPKTSHVKVSTVSDEESCRVFDITKGEWRSFKYSAILKVKFTL